MQTSARRDRYGAGLARFFLEIDWLAMPLSIGLEHRSCPVW
jgi:hypothetical protein